MPATYGTGTREQSAARRKGSNPIRFNSLSSGPTHQPQSPARLSLSLVERHPRLCGSRHPPHRDRGSGPAADPRCRRCSLFLCDPRLCRPWFLQRMPEWRVLSFMCPRKLEPLTIRFLSISLTCALLTLSAMAPAYATDARCAQLVELNNKYRGVELTDEQKSIKVQLVAWYKENCGRRGRLARR